MTPSGTVTISTAFSWTWYPSMKLHSVQYNTAAGKARGSGRRLGSCGGWGGWVEEWAMTATVAVCSSGVLCCVQALCCHSCRCSHQSQPAWHAAVHLRHLTRGAAGRVL